MCMYKYLHTKLLLDFYCTFVELMHIKYKNGFHNFVSQSKRSLKETDIKYIRF